MTETAARQLTDLVRQIRASRREHALLINFGTPRIQFKKLILRHAD